MVILAGWMLCFVTPSIVTPVLSFATRYEIFWLVDLRVLDEIWRHMGWLTTGAMRNRSSWITVMWNYWYGETSPSHILGTIPSLRQRTVRDRSRGRRAQAFQMAFWNLAFLIPHQLRSLVLCCPRPKLRWRYLLEIFRSANWCGDLDCWVGAGMEDCVTRRSNSCGRRVKVCMWWKGFSCIDTSCRSD